MVQSCCVPECDFFTGKIGRDGKRVSLHNFPESNNREGQKMKNIWLRRIRRQETDSWKVLLHTKVCSEHFLETDFVHRGIGNKWNNRRLKRSAVPSRFKWITECKRRVNPLEKARLDCQEKIGHKAADTSFIETDEIQILKDKVQELQKENSRLTVELQSLRERMKIWEDQLKDSSPKFTYERFKNSSSDLRFYTSFASSEVLENCYNFLNPGLHSENINYWQSSVTQANDQMKLFDEEEEEKEEKCNIHCCKQGRRRILNSKTEFFLFLCRVRQGFRERHLAHLFNVSVSTVCRIIITWSNYIYLRLGSLNIWPDRNTVDLNMPDSFKKNYPKCRVIIDCTELKVQTPSSMVLVSEFFSNYKNHMTLKALVGCTPSGGCSFVSQLFTGNISDVEIVKRSGFLNMKFDTGDLVLADRGFTIENELPIGVTSKIPSFLNGREQFEQSEVIESQAIAQERIHIERLISRIKAFHIFDGVIPLAIAGSVNQLFTSCCLLTNFQPGIIASLPSICETLKEE